ncbi:glutamine synthetase [Pseudomonas sp. ATCC 13867]|nr:glutamine synthetase [Pseudomonas sp. ATCC 13867]
MRLVRHAVLQEGLELGTSVPQDRVMPAGILRQGNLPHKGASCVPVPVIVQNR